MKRLYEHKKDEDKELVTTSSSLSEALEILQSISKKLKGNNKRKMEKVKEVNKNSNNIINKITNK